MSLFKDLARPFYAKHTDVPSVYNRSRPGYKEENVDLEPLIKTASQLVGKEVIGAVRLGTGFFNVVYNLEMKSGEPIVARIQWHFKTDEKSLTWTLDKMSREIAVLELLRRVQPEIPVPRVLKSILDISNPVGAPFVIMNRLYGEDQWSAWPKLSATERVTFVKSLAAAAVGIFEVRLPGTGCLQELTTDGRPVIGSALPFTPRMFPCQPYETIDEYVSRHLEYVFTQEYDQTLYDFSLSNLFDRVRSLAKRSIPRDDPAMLVPVLVHVDLDCTNIMIKDAAVSGILDWEFHLALPACLGASYPEFLRFDGKYDPKYSIVNRLMPTKESWATEEEGVALRAVFRETAASLSPEYERALDKGEVLRQLSELLLWRLEDPEVMRVLEKWERETSARYV